MLFLYMIFDMSETEVQRAGGIRTNKSTNYSPGLPRFCLHGRIHKYPYEFELWLVSWSACSLSGKLSLPILCFEVCEVLMFVC